MDIPELAKTLSKKAAVFAYRRATTHLWLTFMGGTGTGKSTLFNALVDRDISLTGVERPKTSGPIAYAHRDAPIQEAFPFPAIRLIRNPEDAPGAVPAGGAPDRLLVLDHGRPEYAPWIVVDTPDLDSVEPANRRIAEDLYLLSDVVIFVSSKEKYADEVPFQFLTRVIREGSPCFVLLNKATSDLGKAEVLEALAGKGARVEEGSLRLVPYGTKPSVRWIRELPAFHDFVNDLRKTYGPGASAAFRKDQLDRTAAELRAGFSRLRELLSMETRAGREWLRRLNEVHEKAFRELIREERERFTEKSRRYMGKEIRRLFSRYDVLAKPRKIVSDIVLAPFRAIGLLSAERTPDAEEAVSKVQERADPGPLLSAVQRFNRLVLETLSPSNEMAPIYGDMRREGVALDRDEVLGLIRENHAGLVSWLQERFRELADGISAGKKWGIYSTSILWGLLLLTLEGVVGGGFTVLDAVLGSALAPFVTKGAVELFAYQEIQKVARELARRYQDGLLAVMNRQRERYEECLSSLLPAPDFVDSLKELPRRLEHGEPWEHPF